jgi:hypothetical protein
MDKKYERGFTAPSLFVLYPQSLMPVSGNTHPLPLPFPLVFPWKILEERIKKRKKTDGRSYS